MCLLLEPFSGRFCEAVRCPLSSWSRAHSALRPEWGPEASPRAGGRSRPVLSVTWVCRAVTPLWGCGTPRAPGQLAILFRGIFWPLGALPSGWALVPLDPGGRGFGPQGPLLGWASDGWRVRFCWNEAVGSGGAFELIP